MHARTMYTNDMNFPRYLTNFRIINNICIKLHPITGIGWRHLVIAVWCFDGSIGQCAGEFFFFGPSAGARPDRWSIRRPLVRLTRCWTW
ncbi:hypothetical protein T10_6329 [Trichinella papuae]|uniref:Uncharacterized protein n=1 Tax=Trichinella papuae TaxID=268474 RepID=A0A0V1N2T2_9BILA|nr:hypothetical protein T10_6329 [Trichinella papuae]